MTRNVLLMTLSFALISCADHGTAPVERPFNLTFSYGVRLLNELNTFEDKFTKDLVLDGTITVPFFLTDADFDTIESKLLEIGFFDFPDTFIVGLGDSIIGYIDPPVSAFFDVKQGGVTKTLFWVDGVFTLVADPRVEKLSEAFFLIRSIIESKPAYQRLPPARGGYI